MNGSWKLGNLAGIDLRVHWTFLLLPVWVYASTVSTAGTFFAAYAVLFVLAVFGCIVLHELGHALAARGYGINTRDITLLPIGGVAALERMPRAPIQEFVIAVAGPLVNVVIAAVIFVALPVLGGNSAAIDQSMFGQFMYQLGWVNILLVLFNMIPAFPMDGGRVLRSLLATKLPYSVATRIAAFVGQLAAIGLGLLGLFSGNFMLILVAGFVYLAAAGERQMVMMSERQMPQSSDPFQFFTFEQPGNFSEPVTIDENSHPAIPAEMSAQSAMTWMSRQQDDICEVVASGKVIGQLTRLDLLRAIADGLGTLPIRKLLGVQYG